MAIDLLGDGLADLTGGSLGLILGLMNDLLGIVYDPVNSFLGGFGKLGDFFLKLFFLDVDLLGRLVLYVINRILNGILYAKLLGFLIHRLAGLFDDVGAEILGGLDLLLIAAGSEQN